MDRIVCEMARLAGKRSKGLPIANLLSHTPPLKLNHFSLLITMKTHLTHFSAALVALTLTSSMAADWTAGMQEGAPSFKTMGPLAFGPDGILFIGDSKSGSVTAIATDDTSKAGDAEALKVESINVKIAGLLGASADQLVFDDLAVNPISRNAYLAVSRGRGPDAISVLVRVSSSGKPEVVSLEKVKFAVAQLPDAPEDKETGEGRRRSNPRLEAITDIAFFQDRLLIAGLSNEEFASTFRAIPFPFKNVEGGTSVEIFHGAHGRFETRSPVRTFVPFNIGNEPHLLAAYTCTPLVQFPVKQLKSGAKIKGKTIAELGNRNRPIDMIVYKKDGKDYLLLANSSRGIMKIDTAGIEAAPSIEAKVADKEGVPYDTIDALTGVDQLDLFGKGHALVLRTAEDKSLSLESVLLP